MFFRYYVTVLCFQYSLKLSLQSLNDLTLIVLYSLYLPDIILQVKNSLQMIVLNKYPRHFVFISSHCWKYIICVVLGIEKVFHAIV